MCACVCASTSVREPRAGIYLSALRKCNELHYVRPARCELFRWSSVVLHRDRSERRPDDSIFLIETSGCRVLNKHAKCRVSWESFKHYKHAPKTSIPFDDNGIRKMNSVSKEKWILDGEKYTYCVFFFTGAHTFLMFSEGLRNNIPSKMIDSIIRDNCYCYGKS